MVGKTPQHNIEKYLLTYVRDYDIDSCWKALELGFRHEIDWDDLYAWAQTKGICQCIIDRFKIRVVNLRETGGKIDLRQDMTEIARADAQSIKVADFHVADSALENYGFIDDPWELWLHLAQGDEILFVDVDRAEPVSPFLGNTTMDMMTHCGRRIGPLPGDQCDTVASLRDAGHDVYGRVTEADLSKDSPYEVSSIFIDVMIREQKR